MRTIAVANQKGGSGKTTLSLHLAVELCTRGQLAGVLDADPQGSAETWYRLRQHLNPERRAVPAPHPLVRMVNPTSRNSFAGGREDLEAVGCEVAIIDCPPALAEDTKAALLVADVVVIPVRPGPLDVWSTRAILDLAGAAADERTQRGYGEPAHYVVPFGGTTRTKIFTELKGYVFGLELLHGVKPVSVSLRVAVAEALNEGLTLQEYEPDNPGCREFSKLADQVQKLLESTSEEAS